MAFTGVRQSKKQKGGQSRLLITCGILLLAAALLLTVYNLWSEQRAEASATQALQELETQLEQREAPSRPLYELYPNMEMPVLLADGKSYIGVLDIPALGLSLPVISQWSYPDLKLAPCRYTGSAYSGNLILAGHNYPSHFGGLKNLRSGDTICFTDADGNQFFYQVAELEVLDGTAVEEMTAGDWQLTLFTCTYGGQSRVAVRCVSVMPSLAENPVQ